MSIMSVRTTTPKIVRVIQLRYAQCPTDPCRRLTGAPIAESCGLQVEAGRNPEGVKTMGDLGRVVG